MARCENLWLSFAGRTSASAGARVTKLSIPNIAAHRGASVEIPGRDGALWLDAGAMDEIEIEAEMMLKPGATRESIGRWLRGEGELVTSYRPAHFIRARVTDAIRFESPAPGALLAKATFICEPFYRLRNEPKQSLVDPTHIIGRGDLPARPWLSVYASGDVTLAVGACLIELTGVSGHIALDCEAMMATKNGESMGHKVALLAPGEDGDEWPRLKPGGGTTRIDWRGDVTRVDLIPRWRYL